MHVLQALAIRADLVESEETARRGPGRQGDVLGSAHDQAQLSGLLHKGHHSHTERSLVLVKIDCEQRFRSLWLFRSIFRIGSRLEEWVDDANN